MKIDVMPELCKTCKTISCCTDFVPPFLTTNELELIKEKTGLTTISEDFSIDGVSVHSLKAKPNTQTCMFLDSDQKCTIYDYRPFDCRIFPFDIYKINGSYTWIVYSCNPNSDWKWSEEILDGFEKTLLTPNIVNHMDSFSNLNRMKSQQEISYDYQVLRKVDFSKHIKSLQIKCE